jgi:hypothetical protein
LHSTCEAKEFLTNLLIELAAAIQIKSEEGQISLQLEGFYDQPLAT